MAPRLSNPHPAPASRQSQQSAAVVWILTPALLALSGSAAAFCFFQHAPPWSFGLAAVALSATLALLTWTLRAATPAAALCGALISLLLLQTGGLTLPSYPTHSRTLAALLHSGFPGLLLLFLLTFAATRLGSRHRRHGKSSPRETRELRRGRQASQVLANLGPAGLIAGLLPLAGPSLRTALLTALFAALAEATADTVSSEIGSAFGGIPILVTTLRRAAPGTDGAVSLLGTLAGAASSLPVALCLLLLPGTHPAAALIAWLAGLAGLFLDSLLGATLERYGLLTNDPVNLLSNLAAALLALSLHH